MLFADYGCEFENKNYLEICQRAIKSGVSGEYVNEFLTSPSKIDKFDEASLNAMQPALIPLHKKNEKKANNTLVEKYLPEIVAHLKEYAEVYDYAESRYGVNREIVASILMKETKLGKIKLTHDAFTVFNTMVVKSKPETDRDKWLINMGKSNMVSIIKHCFDRGIGVEECTLPSSYAGAIGIPQFMPNNFAYAEGYKKEIGDLTNMSDAIVSTSKYLYKKGSFTQLIDWDNMPNIAELESKWYEFQENNDNASFCYDKNPRSNEPMDCYACDKSELNSVRECSKKIMRYNNSSNYAVGVIRLAYDAHKMLKSQDISPFETKGF